MTTTSGRASTWWRYEDGRYICEGCDFVVPVDGAAGYFRWRALEHRVLHKLATGEDI